MTPATMQDDFRAEGDVAARDRLVQRHLPLVRHIARRVARSLPDAVELEDLVSAGAIGLLNAIDRFEPDRGIAFSTFAAPRIRGAILDDLRRWDHASRTARRKQRALAAARETLIAQGHESPSAEATAQAVGIPVEELWRWELDANADVRLSLSQHVDRESRSISPADVLADEAADGMDDRLEYDELVALTREAIAQLPERERQVLALYYYEELKLHEIGAVLDITESRVSQIRTKALRTLRESLGHLRRSE
jgi:RNA polymerase sigma factor for flagellar operon FliA